MTNNYHEIANIVARKNELRTASDGIRADIEGNCDKMSQTGMEANKETHCPQIYKYYYYDYAEQ